MPLPKLPSFRLDGKSALVTGASKGIGLAAAAALAQAGARVTLAARTRKDLVEACDSIREQCAAQCSYLQLDVTDSQTVERELAALGPFDILVNNAGQNRPKPLVDVTDGDIDDLLAVNLKSVFYVSRVVLKKLIATGTPGSIINISSQMGVVGSPNRTIYCATKHGIEGLTKALAWETAKHGVRVNSICPTFIETPLTQGMLANSEFREWVTGKIAFGRLGRVEEVMGAVVFLASEASSLMTGSALMLDGGWSAA